jgi:CHAT domain-containing protein
VHTEAEIGSIRRLVPEATVLSGDEATRERVIEELPRHGVHHFICHGRADERDALASCLRLPDADLTVRDLLAVRLSGTSLAFLSACETGVPHPELFDELVGLPSALLEAGAGAVIGSLWEVPGQATVLLASRFYELWLLRGKPPVEALNQAQRWLRDSTNGELLAYSRGFLDWRNNFTGNALRVWESERGFSDPDAWAAFVYTGA